MEYRLNVKDGMVEYLMMAGESIVRASMSEERARWAMERNGVEVECIGGHPEYAIHAGAFFFDAVPVKRRKRKKDAVCGNDYCEMEG